MRCYGGEQTTKSLGKTTEKYFALFSCAANGPTDPKEEPIGIVGIERRGSITSAKSVFSKSLVL